MIAIASGAIRVVYVCFGCCTGVFCLLAFGLWLNTGIAWSAIAVSPGHCGRVRTRARRREAREAGCLAAGEGSSSEAKRSGDERDDRANDEAFKRSAAKRRRGARRARLDRSDKEPQHDRTRWCADEGCWGSEQTESDGTHAGDDTVPDAKARIMRAFSWAAFGKGCIRMRQDRAESDVVQDTLF